MTYTIEAPPGMQEEEVGLSLESSEEFGEMILQAETEIAQGAYYDWEEVCESLNKKCGKILS